MILRIYSDIHQENRAHDPFVISEDKNEKDQILIIAGDYDLLKNLNRPKQFIQFKLLCERFKAVFYTFGNHEFYLGKIGGHYDQKHIDLFKSIPNLHILSRHSQSVIIDDHCFIGATLWTQLGEWDQLNSRADGCSNDGKYIKQVQNNRYSGLKKGFWNTENSNDFLWLKQECKKYENYKKVVITHYPPIRILEPLDPLGIEQNYYSNDLSTQISYFKNISAWIFGHIHLNKVFNEKRDGFLFYSNPIGYEQKEDILTNSILKL